MTVFARMCTGDSGLECPAGHSGLYTRTGTVQLLCVVCGVTGQSRGHWVQWNALVPEFGSSAANVPPAPLSTVLLVPTVETARTEYLVDVLACQGKPVLLIGDRGSAKSVVIRHYLSKKNAADDHLSKTVVFSSVTTVTTLQVHESSSANIISL